MAFDQILLLAGATLGASLYLYYGWVKAARRPSPTLAGARMIEAGLCGVGFVMGFYLSYGAVNPTALVHLVDDSNNHVDAQNLFVPVAKDLSKKTAADEYKKIAVKLRLGDFHLVHIFLLGFASAILAGGGLYRFCYQKPEPPIVEPPPIPVTPPGRSRPR